MNLRSNLSIILSIFISLLFIENIFASVPQIPRMPEHYVVDLANIIDDDVEMRLNGYLQELEQKTTAQVVVLTINSLEDESLEEFSIEVAHKRWKLGQKGKDNGVLILIVFKDRKYRIEVGYGLEGILPDSLVGSIGRKFLVPYMKKGDPSTGIYTTTLAIINEIATNEGITIVGMPKINKHTYYSRRRGNKGIFSGILTFIFIIGAILLFIKYPRLFLLLLFTSSMGGFRRDGWSGGGGFGSGFGGFGGGGGGGFGGGGASGGW